MTPNVSNQFHVFGMSLAGFFAGAGEEAGVVDRAVLRGDLVPARP